MAFTAISLDGLSPLEESISQASWFQLQGRLRLCSRTSLLHAYEFCVQANAPFSDGTLRDECAVCAISTATHRPIALARCQNPEAIL